MVISPREKTLPMKSRAWPGPLFFLACYAYLWLVVDPRLIYDGFGTIVLNVPVFAADWRSLREAVDLPGGLAAAAYGFLSHGFYYSWLGAVVVTLTALSLGVLTRLHCLRTGSSSANVLPYFPAILIVMLYNRHDHPLEVCLTLSLGLLF